MDHPPVKCQWIRLLLTIILYQYGIKWKLVKVWLFVYKLGIHFATYGIALAFNQTFVGWPAINDI